MTTPPQPVQDVLCLAIPEQIDPMIYMYHPSQEVRSAFIDQLSDLAQQQIWGQWPPGRQPLRIMMSTADWLITDNYVTVSEFQPAHDCPICRLGNTRAEAFLREHPGRWIAMANLTYTPVWND